MSARRRRVRGRGASSSAAPRPSSTIADLAEPGEDPVLANLGRMAAAEGAQQAAFQVERSCRRADGARLDVLISAALLHGPAYDTDGVCRFEERRRLAGDLHDDAVQSLTARMQLSILDQVHDADASTVRVWASARGRCW
jgi:signal transduction histidine kinase